MKLFKKVKKENKVINFPTHPATCDSSYPECLRKKAYELRDSGNFIEFTDDNEGVLTEKDGKMICPCGKYTQNLIKNE